MSLRRAWGSGLLAAALVLGTAGASAASQPADDATAGVVEDFAQSTEPSAGAGQLDLSAAAEVAENQIRVSVHHNLVSCDGDNFDVWFRLDNATTGTVQAAAYVGSRLIDSRTVEPGGWWTQVIGEHAPGSIVSIRVDGIEVERSTLPELPGCVVPPEPVRTGDMINFPEVDGVVYMDFRSRVRLVGDFTLTQDLEVYAYFAYNGVVPETERHWDFTYDPAGLGVRVKGLEWMPNYGIDRCGSGAAATVRARLHNSSPKDVDAHFKVDGVVVTTLSVGSEETHGEWAYFGVTFEVPRGSTVSIELISNAGPVEVYRTTIDWTCVMPVPPIQTCNTVTIPEVRGVQYFDDSEGHEDYFWRNVVSAGEHQLQPGQTWWVGAGNYQEHGWLWQPGNVAEVFQLDWNPDSEFGGWSWTFEYDADPPAECEDVNPDPELTAPAPVFSDVCGAANDTVTLVPLAGVEYLVNGSVRAAGTHPASGSVSVVARARPGYQLSGTSSWTYQFTDLSFPDVPDGRAFHDEICWLAGQGVTTGNSDGTFRPADPVARGAMAAFLYRFAGEPEFTAPTTSPFSDVATTRPLYHEITWLASTGITTGHRDGTYRPADAVGRGAMAAFLYRYAGEPEFTPPAKSPFSDVATTGPFYHEITWLASTGITTGHRDGTFRPSEVVARGAMAAFLYRADGFGIR